MFFFFFFCKCFIVYLAVHYIIRQCLHFFSCASVSSVINNYLHVLCFILYCVFSCLFYIIYIPVLMIPKSLTKHSKKKTCSLKSCYSCNFICQKILFLQWQIMCKSYVITLNVQDTTSFIYIICYIYPAPWVMTLCHYIECSCKKFSAYGLNSFYRPKLRWTQFRTLRLHWGWE